MSDFITGIFGVFHFEKTTVSLRSGNIFGQKAKLILELFLPLVQGAGY